MNNYHLRYAAHYIRVMTFSKLESPWSTDEIQEFRKSKNISDLPVSDDNLMLQQVLMLLLTTSTNEENAVFYYLEPLTGHSSIYKYTQLNSHQPAIYHIGKYGTWPVAVRQVTLGAKIGAVASAPEVALKCFENLNTVISVGVAQRVKSNDNIYDVLVADKIIKFDHKFQEVDEGFQPSQLLSYTFMQNQMWPDSEIMKCLEKYNVPKPEIRNGILISEYNCKLTEKDLTKKFGGQVISIDIEAAHLFAKNVTWSVHMTIVKALCDFKEEYKNDATAALLAANCVKRCLDKPELPKMLKKNQSKYVYKINLRHVYACNYVATYT